MALLFILVSVSCARRQNQYIIGISQCSDDIWREKQNAELRMGAYFHENVELRFAAAYDSDSRQLQQIDDGPSMFQAIIQSTETNVFERAATLVRKVILLQQRHRVGYRHSLLGRH